MRAIKAKRLRKQARAVTVGLPERSLVAYQQKKLVTVKGDQRTTISLQVFNSPKSARGVYRRMKNDIELQSVSASALRS